MEDDHAMNIVLSDCLFASGSLLQGLFCPSLKNCKHNVLYTLVQVVWRVQEFSADIFFSSSVFPSYISGVHHFWVRFLDM